MPKHPPAIITIIPTSEYVPGVPAITYTGPPESTIASVDGRNYTLAELLAFRPAAFVIGPPAEPGLVEPEVPNGTD